MKRNLLLLCTLMVSLFSCQVQEEDAPVLSINITDSFAADYNAVDVVCSVSGNMTVETLIMEYDADQSLSSPMRVESSGKSASYTLSISNLNPQTTYYYRYTVKNRISTYKDPTVRQFKTKDCTAPQVTTVGAQVLSATQATLEGRVESNGGKPISAQGFKVGKDKENLESRPVSWEAFSLTLENLEYDTKYYYKAYATNDVGTGEGELIEFTTQSGVAEVATSDVTDITSHTATFIGEIKADGGSPILERGFCYSEQENPTVDSNKIKVEGSTGQFTAMVTGLAPINTYYVKAYAINARGTHYGSQLSFTTASIPVESIILSESTLTLLSGVSETLTATVLPEDATDKTITWSTSDPSIATVNNGRVTAVAAGTATITALAGGKTATCEVTVDEIIQFEDANFKAYCVSNFDKDGDGEVSLTEAKQVISIKVNTDNITSTKGIEFMPNLNILIVRGSSAGLGKLKSLDVSKNTILGTLYCNNNQLTSLVLGSITLHYLQCGGNQLTSLDVSNNTELTELLCNNNQLTYLNISNNTALTALECKNNQLMSLDVSNNSALNYLMCQNNPSLTKIWIKKNQSITNFQYDTDVATIHYVEIITFKSTGIKSKLVKAFDKDGDGEVSNLEASKATSLKGVFGYSSYTSFDEYQYFTGLTSVEDNLFENWSNLQSITLPSTIKAIGTSAFRNCYKLAMIAFPDSLTSIGSYAFYGCTGLSGDLILPSSLQEVGSYAFSDCTGLNGRLVIPTETKGFYIKEFAFNNCSNFVGDLVISENVNTYDNCFNNAGFTGSVYIACPGTAGGEYHVYQNCKIGGNLIIQDNVKSVSGDPFKGATVGGYIYIGNSVTNISIEAFYQAEFTKVYVAAIKPPHCLGDLALHTSISLSGRYLGVPKGQKDAYSNASPWNEAATIEEVDFSDLKITP